MQFAYDWLTKYYDFQWYYQYEGDKIVSAHLFQRKDSVSVTELSITVVDRRAEYYDKKDLMRGS